MKTDRKDIRRICVEFPPPGLLERPEVVKMLIERGIAPMRAAHHDADDEALVESLRPYVEAGLEVALWPLVADGEGYWPSLHNLEAVIARVERLLHAMRRRDLHVPWMAMDFEPRPDDTDGLRHGGVPRFVSTAVGVLARGTVLGYDEVADAYARLSHRLRDVGMRTLAIAYPFVAGDPRGGHGLGRMCEAPLDAGWDRVAVMTYSSMLAGYSRGILDLEAARWYAYRTYRRLVAIYGDVGAFVGIVGRGRLGDERSHERPMDLEAEVAAARSAGVVEVSGYCLEGMLERPEPERWLDALASTERRVPRRSIRGELLYSGGRAAGAALGIAMRRRP